ncbi:hypothetical protein Nepgr_026687 [Nepenthes gracilis]|uniref:Uncharacterized protein n=1 Tax=Nepenthes gracilis TaxID=150966 RepID=A0AAD3T9H3_NEPGR|nr:hypothetical protein Nepgr_026687 [Nepenthes gracilis]
MEESELPLFDFTINAQATVNFFSDNKHGQGGIVDQSTRALNAETKQPFGLIYDIFNQSSNNFLSLKPICRVKEQSLNSVGGCCALFKVLWNWTDEPSPGHLQYSKSDALWTV